MGSGNCSCHFTSITDDQLIEIGQAGCRAGRTRGPWSETKTRRSEMTIGTILVILLVLALVGVIPTWGYSSGWGYGPSGGIGLVLLIVLILILTGTV
jgi:hypothetical protein